MKKLIFSMMVLSSYSLQANPLEKYTSPELLVAACKQVPSDIKAIAQGTTKGVMNFVRSAETSEPKKIFLAVAVPVCAAGAYVLTVKAYKKLQTLRKK